MVASPVYREDRIRLIGLLWINSSEYGDSMELNWQLLDGHDQEQIKTFANQLNSSPVLAKILLNRGIDNIEDARKFFIPKLENLHDPFEMAGMHTAVERFQSALANNEKVLVYGDYDVDGTTATSLMYLFLKSVGCTVEYYIPDRITEGYGVSDKGIEYARENGISLIITVDCGVTATREIALAKSHNIDFIVCDHHQPDLELPPAVAVLNPKRSDCPYPFKELAGVGVAFKFLQAYQQKTNLDESEIFKYLPLVAMGSAADIVPLADENRTFVRHGLETICDSSNVGLNALIDITALKGKDIGTGQVVFVLAPRINAVGRLGDADRAVHLLTTDNHQTAANIARILESENHERRLIDETTREQAFEIIESNESPPADEYAFVLNQEQWHPGVIGIVASRIVERYFRPTIMIATENGMGKGSARSIPGFDIYETLKECSDLMTSFGGHKYAAGLSIETEKIPLLREKFCQIASERLTEDMLIPDLTIEAELDFKDITPEFLKLMDKMAPFGPKNSRPNFLSKKLEVVGSPTIVGKNHLKFKVRQSGVVMDAIGFNLGDKIYRLSPGEANVDVVYVIDENHFRGRTTIQLRVKDLR